MQLTPSLKTFSKVGGTIARVRPGGDGDPWYVTAKDMQRNRLVVVQGHDHPSLLSDRLTAADLNWISGTQPHCQWVYTAKTRYRQKDAPCAIASASAGRCMIEFAEPQWAVTPGQSVVVYESQVCLGGGIIESASRASAAESRSEECPPNTIDARDESGGMRAEK